PRGHLSNDDAARALARTAAGRARTVCLVHLSEVNNLAPLARDTALDAIASAGGAAGQVLAVPPNGRTCPIVLGSRAVRKIRVTAAVICRETVHNVTRRAGGNVRGRSLGGRRGPEVE